MSDVISGAGFWLFWLRLQRCTESEFFDSDSTPASAEYTPNPLRHILKFWTPTPAQTPK